MLAMELYFEDEDGKKEFMIDLKEDKDLCKNFQ